MKVLIAPDSFKNSMSAKKAAESIYKGAKKVIPHLEAVLIPLSDGGEGFTESLVESGGGNYVEVNAHDALMRNIKTRIGLIDNGNTAIVELAAAAGIELLTREESDPWNSTTFGVGELILSALDHACKKIIIGLGGSATNDAGVGLAMALGVEFLDEFDNEIGLGGRELGKLRKIDTTRIDKRLSNLEIVVACDVTNVLYGKNGASLIYGPQKGADPEMVKRLDENLEHFSNVLKTFCGKDISNVPGSGAAGGTASSLMSLFGAKLVPGFDLIKRVTQLDKIIPTCDLVITGEGKIDYQTAFGKVPGSLARLAFQYNKPVVAFAGLLGEGHEALYKEGFSSIISIIDKPMSLEDALINGSLLLEQASERYFRTVGIQFKSPM